MPTISNMVGVNGVVMQSEDGWWQFCDPVQVICTRDVGQVQAALREVETAVSQHHLYAAGFLSYEASAAFDLAAHPTQASDPPLLWFGLYQHPESVQLPSATAVSPGIDWHPAITEAVYQDAIAYIKDQIATGYTYQVNFTFPLVAPFHADPWALFCRLAQAQQAAYAAYLDIGSHVICSASPELFFQLDGDRLLSRPMKGTAPRGRTLVEDQANAAWLHHSEKNRAENVMIVDMIRNDMGRVAQIGSVHVPQLFAVEHYPTVLQMTSTVTARTTASLGDIFAAMYPCASITGAPKRSTTQIIKNLEKYPRGVYTGAIGYLAPERRARFNVAIRTVVVNRSQGQAVYGVGGGIVWDSEAAAEYAECRLKARVLTQSRPKFHLLESLRWTPEAGYFLLEEHLARLGNSAAYFGYPADLPGIHQKLAEQAAALTAAAKVRLLLAADGTINLEAAALAEMGGLPLRVALAPSPVDSDNLWLYHKTTRREVYEAARAACPHCDDVLLWNERGELTEATIANVVLELDGELVTPPVEAGLLAGTYRNWLLQHGRICERAILLTDLPRAGKIWLINSVRGWQEAVIAKAGE